MHIYDISQIKSDPSTVFHQANVDSVFIDFEGYRYEIKQVQATPKSPLAVAGLSQFHQHLQSQAEISTDDILESIQAGRERY